MNSTKIAVIDFSQEDCLKPGTSSWVLTSKQICYALEELSYFMAIVPNKIHLELQTTFFGTLDDLFDFPTEIKLKIAFEKPYFSCYLTPNNVYQSLEISYGTDVEDTRKFTHHFWPNGNDLYRQDLNLDEGAELYPKVMEEVHHVVTRMVFENYGVDKYHDDHIQSVVHVYRFNQYREFGKTGVEGLPGHTDKGFSTILYQNHVNGLEIKSKQDGDEWLCFDPLPSSFMFLAGDGFQVWSNDRIRACKHRVTLKGKDVRYSFGLFAYTLGETKIPEELVDKEHPIQYKPLDLLEYLQYFKKNFHTLGPEYSIKAYCGV